MKFRLWPLAVLCEFTVQQYVGTFQMGGDRKNRQTTAKPN